MSPFDLFNVEAGPGRHTLTESESEADRDAPGGPLDLRDLPVPDGWEASGDAHAVTFQSPDTCFWTAAVFPDRPGPAAVVSSALDGLREEYEDLEVTPTPGPPSAAGETARDAAFFCLDATVTARARAFRTATLTCLVFQQGDDRDLEEHAAVLDALTRRFVRRVCSSS